MGSNWNAHTFLVEMYNGTADVKNYKNMYVYKR